MTWWVVIDNACFYKEEKKMKETPKLHGVDNIDRFVEEVKDKKITNQEELAHFIELKNQKCQSWFASFDLFESFSRLMFCNKWNAIILHTVVAKKYLCHIIFWPYGRKNSPFLMLIFALRIWSKMSLRLAQFEAYSSESDSGLLFKDWSSSNAMQSTTWNIELKNQVWFE